MQRDDLSMGVEQVADAIIEATGAEPGDTVELVTPEFERQDGIEPGDPPLTHGAMDRLKTADEPELKDLGLRKWSDETGLWLLPHEWHPHLPLEYPMLNILDEETCRDEYPTSPDKRFGVLSFGIVPNFEERDGDA